MSIRFSSVLVAALLLPACQQSPEEAPSGGGKTEFLGLGIAYAFEPPLDNIRCSGQMKPEQFDQLKACGIERVICLRDAKEKGTGWEEERAKAAGIEFIRMPISGKTGITPENAAKLSEQLDPAVSTLVACGSSNRVGALFALRAQKGGATPEAALELGRKCGLTKLEPVVKQALGMQ